MAGTGPRHSNIITALAACLTAVGLVLALAATAQARVTRIAVEKKISPAFDGASFGAAGQYETLAGKADGKAVKVVLGGVNVNVYKTLKLMKLAPRFGFLS